MHVTIRACGLLILIVAVVVLLMEFVENVVCNGFTLLRCRCVRSEDVFKIVVVCLPLLRGIVVIFLKVCYVHGVNDLLKCVFHVNKLRAHI